jgi:hypothetical protein
VSAGGADVAAAPGPRRLADGADVECLCVGAVGSRGFTDSLRKTAAADRVADKPGL